MSLFSWIRGEVPDEVLRAPVTATSREGHLEAYSETWIFVSNWAEAEVNRLREANDAVTLDATQTAALRGRIKALRDLLALPDKKERPKRRSVIEDDEY